MNAPASVRAPVRGPLVEGVMQAAGGDPRIREGLDARLVEEVGRKLPLGEELLRFFDANRYAMLPLRDLASRLLRDPELIRAALDRLVALGFLVTEGRGPVFVLTRDQVKVREIEELLRVLSTTPGGQP